MGRRGFHTRTRPNFEIGDDLESITGRHAVNQLGLSVGEVVYLRGTIVDARIAPGERSRVMVTLTDPDGKILDADVQVEPGQLVRSSAITSGE